MESCQKNGIEIRRVRLTDCRQLADLLACCIPHAWSQESIRASLDDPAYFHLVACRGGLILGYIGMIMALDQADITNVAVDPRWRRKGLAAALLQELICRAEEGGIQEIFLEVRSSNQAAICLYEQAGFIRTGLRKNYYAQPREDALLMMRSGQKEQKESPA